MSQLTGTRRVRYELVTAAHEFNLAALPFRHPDSRYALARFVDAATGCRIAVADADAVLLDLLSVLHPHAGGRLPSLVDRYLAQRRHFAEPIARFRECVEDVIRYRGVGNRDVQQAIAIIEERYTDCTLTQAGVAEEVDLLPQDLSALFKRQTGLTFTEYLRDLRLDRAARLLATTDRRIKDIWVEVGYNDASNFDHQFKERFGHAPRDYRATSIPTTMAPPAGEVQSAQLRPNAEQQVTKRGTVLIVEDNQGTRETIGRHLHLSGYQVVLASTGQEGLREARRVDPQVVVLDHNLPDMDGLDWLRALRQQTRGSGPSVLLFTADWDVADDAKEIRALGAMFASKLCDLEELDRLIESLLAAHTRFEQVSGPGVSV